MLPAQIIRPRIGRCRQVRGAPHEVIPQRVAVVVLLGVQSQRIGQFPLTVAGIQSRRCARRQFSLGPIQQCVPLLFDKFTSGGGLGAGGRVLPDLLVMLGAPAALVRLEFFARRRTWFGEGLGPDPARHGGCGGGVNASPLTGGCAVMILY